MDKTAISLVWITHDQRVQDHQGLTEAAAMGLPILVVYGLAQRELSPTSYGWLKTGPFRLKFLYDSLTDLHASLQSLQVAFHYCEGDLQEAFKLVASQYDIRHLFSEHLVGEEEKEDFHTLNTVFPQAKIHHYSLDTMIHPDDLPFSLSQLPMVFTDAKRLIESKSKVRAPLPTIARQQIHLSIPSNLDKLHAHLDSSIDPFLKGGEQAAHHHIDAYM
jgi:deoxyribodipyrimidine photo-lyase